MIETIECFYKHTGFHVIGWCPSLGLETEAFLSRENAESTLVKMVLKEIRKHYDDVCFVHHQTETEVK